MIYLLSNSCVNIRSWYRETEFFLLCFLQHFSELLDEFSQNVLGQLLNDPFLSEKSVSMEVEPSPTSPAPLIQAEHSYSLSEEPRAQSPFTHVTNSDSFNDGKLRAGALAPLTRSNLRVWSVGYSTVSTRGSHILLCVQLCAWVVGKCRETQGTFLYPCLCSLGTCYN